MTGVSRKFIIAVKLDRLPAYRLAQKAGVDSCVLSKLIRGILPVKKMDNRIIRVGKVVGLTPDECFERED